jgi:hypothetical protein
MRTTTAGKLAGIWSLKLQIGLLSSSAQRSATQLVAKLSELGADELIEIDAAEHRRPLARFIRGPRARFLRSWGSSSALTFRA